MRFFIPLALLVALVGCETTKTKTTAPTVNLAATATASASSSQVKWEGEGPVSAVIDGDLATRWSSTFADASVKKPNREKDDNQWVALDLGQKSALTSMRVHWETAAASDYNVQVSDDGRSWNTIDSLRNAEPGPRADNFAFDGISARHVRLKLNDRATEYGYSIYEIEVY